MVSRLLLSSVLIAGLSVFVIFIGPEKIMLSIVDQLFWTLTYIDGIEEANYRQPNYIDGNWRPVVQTLRNVEVMVEGTQLIKRDQGLKGRCHKHL